MVSSLEIRHFRCFESEKLEDCRNINIIVGDNGSGKTALLEAIFLASSVSPEASFRLRQWRGFEGGTMQGSNRQIQDAIWSDLFHNFDQKKNIYIGLGNNKKVQQSLQINHHDTAVVVPLNAKQQHMTNKGGRSLINGPTPITFKWKRRNGDTITATPEMVDGAIKFPSMPSPEFETFFFAANHIYSAFESASRLSMLSKTYKKHEVVEQLKLHFASIQDVSVELTAGLVTVYAKTDFFAEMAPLNLISSGMSKLASIIFAIASQPGGVVLIDEIESGFYFKKLPGIWQMLHSFCKKFDTQIFASTHSGECLQAVSELAKQSPEDFSVIHVGKQKKEKTLLRQFGGEDFVSAMNEHIEIR